MTATTIELGGESRKFLGAHIKNISIDLGLSTNPTTATVVVAEDPDFGVFFTEPTLGKYYDLGTFGAFSFAGVCVRFDRDIRQLGGRLIRVTLADPREVMRAVPVILAPGSQIIAQTVSASTSCSLLDVFGAFSQAGGVINLSEWNEAGMYYKHLVKALSGGGVTYGSTVIPVEQQVAHIFGETYRFDLTDISNRVFDEYRINTNLVPLSNLIEDLSQKFAFDWYIESSRADDGIIDVAVRIVDRSVDNVDISLQDFLDAHEGRVISCSSGVELRNDVACVALQGAPVEQLLKVNINGQANEPIDLTTESGTHAYIMTEDEMRVVMAGRQKWELWLGAHAGPIKTNTFTDASGNKYEEIDFDAGFSLQGYSRYGGSLNDYDINPVFDFRQDDDFTNLVQDKPNIPKNPRRTQLYLAGAKYANSGKIYQKLKAHAEKTYGKRWVHSDIFDEIIDTAWTRDAVQIKVGQSVGANDPNSYFRQSDGRTRAYVEFTSAPQGGAYSFGLADLTSAFGDQSVFRNVTSYGRTFASVLPGQVGQYGDILNLELKGAFNPRIAVVGTLEKSAYTYNDSSIANPAQRTSLYVAATTAKDGVITIDSPIVEPSMSEQELFSMIRRAFNDKKDNKKSRAERREEDLDDVKAQIDGEENAEAELELESLDTQNDRAAIAGIAELVSQTHMTPDTARYVLSSISELYLGDEDFFVDTLTRSSVADSLIVLGLLPENYENTVENAALIGGTYDALITYFEDEDHIIGYPVSSQRVDGLDTGQAVYDTLVGDTLESLNANIGFSGLGARNLIREITNEYSTYDDYISQTPEEREEFITNFLSTDESARDFNGTIEDYDYISDQIDGVMQGFYSDLRYFSGYSVRRSADMVDSNDDDIGQDDRVNAPRAGAVADGDNGADNSDDPQRQDADGNKLPVFDRVMSKLKKLYGNHIFAVGVRAYQPEYAYIPVRSKYNRYGPVFSRELGPSSQGQLQIIQDDGFAPWEFGGVSLMISAMQLKVDNASSLQREVFSANISVENYPAYNIGQAFAKNSNINKISISFGDGGTTTQYGIRTFIRKFGEFTKEDWARLALYANTGALKLTPNQQANFMESARFRVNVNYGGNGGYSSMTTGGVADLG